MMFRTSGGDNMLTNIEYHARVYTASSNLANTKTPSGIPDGVFSALCAEEAYFFTSLRTALWLQNVRSV